MSGLLLVLSLLLGLSHWLLEPLVTWSSQLLELQALPWLLLIAMAWVLAGKPAKP